MSWDVSGWAALVGIVAAIVGVFAALDGLTASTRDRRLAEFLRDEAAAEGETSQGRILVSLRRTAIARVVARDAVPYWQESIPRVIAALILAAAFLRGWLSPPDLSLTDLGFVDFFLATSLWVAFSVVEVAKVTRWMIQDGYLDGATELSAGTRLTRSMSLKLFSRAAGMSVLAVVAVVLLGRILTQSTNAFEVLTLVVAVALLVWLWVLGLRSASWVHPRPAAPTCAVEPPSVQADAAVELQDGEANNIED